MDQTCCLNVGHNFQLASISSANGNALTMPTDAIFCTKCGETRKLEITPNSK